MEQILKSMTLDFFGKGMHKTTPDKLFGTESAIFLDVRSREEAGSLGITLSCYANVDALQIPIHEIPDRIEEIPRDKPVGIFCPANVRASIVYAYLRSKGYENVRIVLGGYAAVTDALKPGPVLAAL